MIRKAIESDIKAICAIDNVAGSDPSRHEYIRRAVRAGNCYVLANDGDRSTQIAAYAVLVYSFYECGMIGMLMVASDHRQRGFGGKLISYLEGECNTQKLFTSTNESNIAMRSLLTKLGYKPSGVIYNLDSGDPELVFFKQLS